MARTREQERVDSQLLGPQRTSPSPSRKRPREKPQGDSEGAENPIIKRSRHHSDPTPTSPHDDGTDPVAFWARNGHWPSRFGEVTPMERLRARKRPSASLLRSLERPEPAATTATPVTPSDQRPREEKSVAYRGARYEAALRHKHSYMDISELGITDTSKRLVRDLLNGQQPVPKETLFDDAVFVDACRNLLGKNEARVIQDISRLIVPSAETLALRDKSLKYLTESVNEGWNNSVPFIGPRPQPDYSVGFRPEAVSDDQIARLSPFIGSFLTGDQSFFMSTWSMFLPFLTCEVKCGAGQLDVADRQNAHSMTLAVRGVAELFCLVDRQDEIDRQILAFSISHNDRYVRIYGHYPVMQGNTKDIKYYRHPIRDFSFAEYDGKEKWTAYTFTKNVYDIWAPAHFRRICSVIDQLPADVDFNVPSLPDTDLSRNLESHGLPQQDVHSLSTSLPAGDGQSSNVEPEAALDTPLTETEGAKRRKGDQAP